MNTLRPLPAQYDAKETEARLQAVWEAEQIHAWDSTQPRANTYVIDTPPPTVSGSLHMGHIFSYTQADFIARFQRMSGKTVFYPMGFDDNGLPTERLVEKMKGKKASQYETREAFIEACGEVTAQARQDFRKLFTSVALSVDWKQEYHTISEHSRRMSQLSFLDLHRNGKAYRQLQPMLWDPIDQTAIAQAEIVDKESPSAMNYIEFGLLGAQTNPQPAAEEESETVALTRETLARGKLLIATTRPELLPACVAVFVHPEDARYAHLVGKHATTSLFNVCVPILADDKVQMEKGTGAVMCCTFGDETDIQWWKTHNLPTRVVLNKYGKMDWTITPSLTYILVGEGAPGINETKEVGGATGVESLLAQLNGLKAEAARAKIIEILKEKSLLHWQDAINHAVKTAERSGATLELLPSHQWFVRVMNEKEVLKEKSRECVWHPEWMAHRMEQWIDGLNWDWCISRQRYFGVPFPVWYSKRAGEEGKVLIADADQLPVNPLTDLPKGYSRDEVEPDRDVMDTWATSSISPQISSGAIEPTLPGDITRHKQLFPADLRPQAHEIIRTWAFYTLVKAHHHENTIPWKNLMISGWCLAEDKSKMSKSKGNVVTPLELIEEFSADVVRYWASTSRLGADTAFSKDLLKIGKKLVNKLWNATKFAAIQLESLDKTPAATSEADSMNITETLDRWILTRLGRAFTAATKAFEEYEYANARAALEDFFWNDFCDNYLEMVKARAYDAEGTNPSGKLSAQLTIHHCLDGILRGFAPFLPHITEELWAHIFPAKFAAARSLHASGTWPKAADYFTDEAAEQSGIAAVELLGVIRKAKSERAVSIKFPIALAELSASAGAEIDWNLLAPIAEDVRSAGNVVEFQWNDAPLSDGLASDNGRLLLRTQFAEQSEVA